MSILIPLLPSTSNFSSVNLSFLICIIGITFLLWWLSEMTCIKSLAHSRYPMSSSYFLFFFKCGRISATRKESTKKTSLSLPWRSLEEVSLVNSLEEWEEFPKQSWREGRRNYVGEIYLVSACGWSTEGRAHEGGGWEKRWSYRKGPSHEWMHARYRSYIFPD